MTMTHGHRRIYTTLTDATLFAQADGALNIAWSRPRRRAEAGFADAAVMGAANDGFGAGEDDRRDASPFGDLEPGLAKAA